MAGGMETCRVGVYERDGVPIYFLGDSLIPGRVNVKPNKAGGWVPLASFGFALMLAAVSGPPARLLAFRLPQQQTGTKCTPLTNWTAQFTLGVFDEEVQAASDTKTVDLTLARGKPKNVVLGNQGKRTFLDNQQNEVVVNFYSGFPTRKEGQATTATAERFKKPVTQGGGFRHHFGLWALITAECCPDWCYIQLILKSKRTLKSGGGVTTLADKSVPELDQGTIEQGNRPCANPNFPLTPSPNKDRSGFTDYPGLPCVEGETIGLENGGSVTLKEGDEIEISDSFRTFITCSGRYVGFVDWGWTGKIKVGKNLEKTELTIEGEGPTFTGSGDTGFQNAVDQAQQLTR